MEGEEQLRRAAAAGCVADVSRLLASGVDPNYRDVFNGSTPLHAAALKGHLEVSQLLLLHGANPNIVTQNTGSSALGMAAFAGHLDVVLALLSNGATLSPDEIENDLLGECKQDGFIDIAAAISLRRS